MYLSGLSSSRFRIKHIFTFNPMGKTIPIETEYKRLVSKRKHQYLKPRNCDKTDCVRLKTLAANADVVPSVDVQLTLTKSDSCWSRCRDRVMSMFNYLFRDDVVKIVVGKSRFDSERSPVPYRTQSVLVSFVKIPTNNLRIY